MEISESGLKNLHVKMDRLINNTTEIDKRLACMETLRDAQKGRCDSHAESIESLAGTVLGNGKPGLTTLIAQLSGRIDTLSATVKERFVGLTREMAIYVIIGAAVTSMLMTIIVSTVANRLNADQSDLKTEIRKVAPEVERDVRDANRRR